MSSTKPLSGNALIDCARANASATVEIAAARCGYEDNISKFRQTLHQACEDIGIEEIKFEDLEVQSRVVQKSKGMEIAPDTASKL